MFGKGIYFADMVTKSANYCCVSSGKEGLMLLAEVALGKQLVLTIYRSLGRVILKRLGFELALVLLDYLFSLCHSVLLLRQKSSSTVHFHFSPLPDFLLIFQTKPDCFSIFLKFEHYKNITITFRQENVITMLNYQMNLFSFIRIELVKLMKGIYSKFS